MWWPMQDYMNLSATRVVDVFDLSDDQSARLRRGIWDIFWNRDYTTYGLANNQTYSFDRWPVSENMYLYVRKDVAAQVWQYGTGDGTVLNPLAAIESSACVANWQQDYAASVVFDTSAVTGGRLQSPIGLDVSADGRVYVADTQLNAIVEFTTDGQFVREFGQQGTVEQSGAFFERPHSVRVAPDGSIYVVDTWNYLVRHLDASGGEEIGRWGRALTLGIEAPVDPVDGFWGPREIALDVQGNVYVADTGNKRVRVYDANGVWLRDIGRGGSGDGQLDEPTGIVVHPDGRVFIADTWNRRIAVFDSLGNWLVNYPVRGWRGDQGNRPYMTMDVERDLLYVGDADASRVLVLNMAGECLGAFGRGNREVVGPEDLIVVGGLDVDAEGNIYVVDSGTGRVLKFPPFPVTAADVPVFDVPVDLPPGQGIPLDLPPDTTEEVQP
jgi:sugar lactone lactonase YvrE